MPSKLRPLCFLFIALLSACGSAPAQTIPPEMLTTATASIRTDIALTQAVLPTSSFTARPLPIFTPSLTPLPSLTPWPSQTPITFTPTPPSSFPLDGYVVVFKKDGDLYFQDENNTPVRLTHGGNEPSSPMISDDNQKIVFTRFSPGEGYSNFYSVNSDGSGEQEIITEQWLNSLGDGTRAFFPVFAPKSHQLAFNTRRCESQDYDALCAVSVFRVDTDTGEIREIVHPDKMGQYDRDGNFKVSPDGKMVSVALSGHIDILDMDGKVVRENVLPYAISAPSELFPDQYWLPDSSGLIAALPDMINYGSAPHLRPRFDVWRYLIEDDKSFQIPLTPSPRMIYESCGDVISVSPDGNWILYDHLGSDSDAYYLNNLNTGQTKEILGACQRYGVYPWSPDGKRYIYGERFLGTINEPAIPVEFIVFGGWIDANHYFFVAADGNTVKRRVAEIAGKTIITYDVDPSVLLKPK